MDFGKKPAEIQGVFIPNRQRNLFHRPELLRGKIVQRPGHAGVDHIFLRGNTVILFENFTEIGIGKIAKGV